MSIVLTIYFDLIIIGVDLVSSMFPSEPCQLSYYGLLEIRGCNIISKHYCQRLHTHDSIIM
jgi:hypothetical protein